MKQDDLQDEPEDRDQEMEALLAGEPRNSKADDGGEGDGAGAEAMKVSRVDGRDGDETLTPSLAVTIENEIEEQQTPALGGRGWGSGPVQERARQAGGTLEVVSTLGEGTTVTATVRLVSHA